MKKNPLAGIKVGLCVRWTIRVGGGLLIALVLLELGLRGLGLAYLQSARNDEGRFRILCVGDSWTHGLGSVSYGEALNQKLQERLGEGAVQVVISGVPGCNSSQGLHRLEELVPELHPDMVIVLLGNNDHQNLAESEYWRFRDERASRRAIWLARTRISLHSLRLYKLGRNLQLMLSGKPTLDAFYRRVGDGRPPPGAAKVVVVDRAVHRRQLDFNLTRIVELSRAHDCELVFMTYFYFHGYRVNETILDVAYRFGVPVVNNTTLFHSRIPRGERRQYYLGAHPTTRGQAFIADNIIELATEEELIPSLQ